MALATICLLLSTAATTVATTTSIIKTIPPAFCLGTKYLNPNSNHQHPRQRRQRHGSTFMEKRSAASSISFSGSVDRFENQTMEHTKRKEKEIEEEILLENAVKTKETQTELWLDLRGTAIAPQTALNYLFETLSEDFPQEDIGGIFTRVILSKDGIAHVSSQEEETVELFDNDVDVWFVNDDENQNYLPQKVHEFNNNDRGPSDKSMGTLVSLVEGVVSDPLPALETASSGGWVIIDSSNIGDETDRHVAVDGLLDLLRAVSAATTGSSSFASSSSTILFAPSSPNDEMPQDTHCQEGGGGIVLACTTKQDIFHAASSLLTFRSSSKLIQTSEHGILLQTQAVEEEEDDPSLSFGQQSSEKNVQTAVLVPFDVMLWKTALLLLRDFDC